jgi:hypothetical protein
MKGLGTNRKELIINHPVKTVFSAEAIVPQNESEPVAEKRKL